MADAEEPEADPAMADVVAVIEKRSAEVVEALAALDVDELSGSTMLPDWDLLTVACHLRYGAQACRQITAAALGGRPSAYYPGGRDLQRPFTLKPALGEPAGHVVQSLAHECEVLTALWVGLDEAEWDLPIIEDDDLPDLGAMSLRHFGLLRLVEVMVHGADLGLGLAPWPAVFGRWVLDARIERARLGADTELVVAFAADGAPPRIVRFSEGVTSPAAADPEVTIGGDANDLVAVLLGRTPMGPIAVDGSSEAGSVVLRGLVGP